MSTPRSRRLRAASAVAAGGLLIAGIAGPADANGPRPVGPTDASGTFQRLATFPVYANSVDPTDIDAVGATSEEAIAEIIDVTPDGKTLAHVNPASERIEIISIANPTKPKPLGTVDVGGAPTSLAILGNHALVAVDRSEDFVDTAGQLVVVDVRSQRIVAAHDLAGQPDSVSIAPSGRYAAVAIENERDEDLGDGRPPQLPGGSLDVVDLVGRPAGWTVRNVALSNVMPDMRFPGDAEPEFVDINGDDLAVVTLQENNHLALVDLPTGEIVEDFPAGAVSLDEVDATEDDDIQLADSLSDVVREPDAVTWITDELFATANEGDLDGGSRGFTVWDAEGEVVHDAGSTFEHLAVRHGHHPERRSENKGVEPEGISYGEFGGRPLLFVGSERGNFVAVYDVTDPAVPVFEQLLPSGGIGPEGLLPIPSRSMFVIANEDDEESRSTVSIWRLEDAPAQYPDLVSADDEDGLPIPWTAISGQAAHPSDPSTFYAVSDSFLGVPYVYEVDTSGDIPTIVARVAVRDPDGIGADDLDLEGIVALEDGTFWLASEGDPRDGRANRLVHVDATGTALEVVELPDALAAGATGSGFEGVSARTEDGALVLYAAIQRPWTAAGDPALHVKIGRYDTESEGWTFAHYVTDPVPEAAAWVGVSEITVVGDRAVLIERDNVLGPLAEVKQVTVVDLPAAAVWKPYGEELPVLSKRVVRDLIPDFTATNGWLPDKQEGLSVQSDGAVWVSNDNDGVDDAVGETQLLDLGSIEALLGGTDG